MDIIEAIFPIHAALKSMPLALRMWNDTSYRMAPGINEPDGKEMYCRMCGNGGELFCCDEEDDSERGTCVFSFCIDCIRRSFGQAEVRFQN